MDKITVKKVDITTLEVDVIVNAANETMLGGGGVDGAIHRKAGKDLMIECWTLDGCKTGQAKITGAYGLPAKYIIHAVGPRFIDGNKGEAALLENCYTNSFKLAVTNQVKSIAFPAISCGIYRYPIDKAAYIAVVTIANCLIHSPSIERVIFACSDETFDIFQDNLAHFTVSYPK
jgi:O-acetyl-ADP-ribose deacetylase